MLTWITCLGNEMKIVIEPSAAIPIAALFKHPDVFHGQRVGKTFVIVSVSRPKRLDSFYFYPIIKSSF